LPIPPIAITAFGGEIPAVDDRLISEGNATHSVNAWLLSGRCEPIRSLQPIHVLANQSARSFFRMPIVGPSIDNMGDSKWLEFENENVRVIRSPVVGQDDDGRFYWADSIYPKYMTGDMILTVPQPPPYRLGVPTPVIAPGVTSSGGVSTTNKTVSYVYTWVTGLGEEGPPSPPTTVVGKLDATYHITMTAPGAPATANRNLTHTRIYRTVVSAQGVATFFFVDEVPIATLTYDDDCSGGTHGGPDSVIVANEQLQSTNWHEPPVDLEGLVTMPNGMVAGWRSNEVWFCEPYFPHAWPVQYVIAVDPIIVGLGVFGQSLIILCEGQPYAATGVHPSAMATIKVQPLETCTSLRSIVNTPNGVLYSSPNGLINITPQGATNLTINTILKSQWNQMLALQSIMASVISQAYYCYSGSQGGVFQNSETPPDALTAFQQDAFQQESHFGTRPGAYISLTDATRLGVTVLDPAPNEVINVITDMFNGETMVLRDGVVYLVDTRQIAPYASYRWRSKIFTLPYLQNMGAAKVYWTPQDPSTTGAPTTFRVFAGAHAELTDDGLPLVFEQKMTESGQMFRLPSGFKALYYQFEVEGYNIINAIHCAQTAHELRAV
jgi:hypothetical protein